MHRKFRSAVFIALLFSLGATAASAQIGYDPATVTGSPAARFAPPNYVRNIFDPAWTAPGPKPMAPKILPCWASFTASYLDGQAKVPDIWTFFKVQLASVPQGVPTEYPSLPATGVFTVNVASTCTTYDAPLPQGFPGAGSAFDNMCGYATPRGISPRGSFGGAGFPETTAFDGRPRSLTLLKLPIASVGGAQGDFSGLDIISITDRSNQTVSSFRADRSRVQNLIIRNKQPATFSVDVSGSYRSRRSLYDGAGLPGEWNLTVACDDAGFRRSGETLLTLISG